MRATDVIEDVEQYIELDEILLTPVNIKKVAGDWVLTNTTTNEELETFSDMAALKNFLSTIGSVPTPDEVLSQSDLNINIPCEAIRMEKLKGQKWDFRG